MKKLKDIKYISHTLDVIDEIKENYKTNKDIKTIRLQATTNVHIKNGTKDNTTISSQYTRSLGINGIPEFDNHISNFLNNNVDKFGLLNIILNKIKEKKYELPRDEIIYIYKVFNVTETIENEFFNKIDKNNRLKYNDIEIRDIILNIIKNYKLPTNIINIKDEIIEIMTKNNIIKSSSNYIFSKDKIDIENKKLSDIDITELLKKNKINFKNDNQYLTSLNHQSSYIETENIKTQSNYRKGQRKIRELTLTNYNNQCALCNIKDKKMLIAAHIERWADNKEVRGDLNNLICLCRFHDALFEYGYISIDDNYKVLKKDENESQLIRSIYLNTEIITSNFKPDKKFLKKHRVRCGFETD